MSYSIHNIIIATACAVSVCNANANSGAPASTPSRVSTSQGVVGALGLGHRHSGPTTANAVKEVHGSGSHGYAPLEVATVVNDNGHATRKPTVEVPEGKVPVVVHSGRPDNGTAWGKHIEYRPQTSSEMALERNETIAEASLIAVGKFGENTIDAINEGKTGKAMLNAAGFGAAVVAIFYCVGKILDSLKDNS